MYEVDVCITLFPKETNICTNAYDCREEYANAVDAKAWDNEPYSKWLTSEHVLHKSTGEVVSGGEMSWATLSKGVYAPFKEHLHDPSLIVAWEVGDGWEMLGVATLYWTLVAPGDGSKTKDRSGKEWDGSSPAGFNFHYVKQSDGGIKLNKTAIYSDPSAAMVTMLKRGMMKPEDLLK